MNDREVRMQCVSMALAMGVLPPGNADLAMENAQRIFDFVMGASNTKLTVVRSVVPAPESPNLFQPQ